MTMLIRNQCQKHGVKERERQTEKIMKMAVTIVTNRRQKNGNNWMTIEEKREREREADGLTVGGGGREKERECSLFATSLLKETICRN